VRARLDLTDLSPDVRAAVESLIADGAVDITRSGEPVGTVSFTSAVLDAAVLPPDPPGRPDKRSEREGAKVVAVTMLMSDAARGRLSDAFGPDYVVLDYQLEGGTAVDVLRAVCPQLPETVFVVLTNHANSQYRRACMQAGATHFFDKSLEFGKVKDVVAAADPLHR